MRFNIDKTKAFSIMMIVFAVITGGLLFTEINSSSTKPDEENLKEIQQQVNMNNEMKEAIQTAHFKLNNTVCWGDWKTLKNSENYAWNFVKNNKLPIAIKKTQKAYELGTNKYVKKDLAKALELLKKGSDQNNVDLLIKAHRILHDLDRFVFNPVDGKKYFGVTNLIENTDLN